MIEARRLQRLFDRVVETRCNCSFEDIERLLVAVGFDRRNARGSHVRFNLRTWSLSIPRRSLIKRVYVDGVIEVVREVLKDG
jgi:hypothetical protein